MRILLAFSRLITPVKKEITEGYEFSRHEIITNVILDFYAIGCSGTF